jgi:hypothetical protein
VRFGAVRGGIGVTDAEAVLAVYPPIFVPPVTVQVLDAMPRGMGSACSVSAVGVVVKTSACPTTGVGFGTTALGPLMIWPFKLIIGAPRMSAFGLGAGARLTVRVAASVGAVETGST